MLVVLLLQPVHARVVQIFAHRAMHVLDDESVSFHVERVVVVRCRRCCCQRSDQNGAEDGRALSLVLEVNESGRSQLLLEQRALHVGEDAWRRRAEKEEVEIVDDIAVALETLFDQRVESGELLLGPEEALQHELVAEAGHEHNHLRVLRGALIVGQLAHLLGHERSVTDV